MKSSIVVLTYNGLEDVTKPCIDSLIQFTDLNKNELIIVDNLSQDETPVYLTELGKKHPEIKIILNQENYGYAKGNNIGIEAATGDFVVLLNNDTIVMENWLQDLLKHYDQKENNWGLVSPISNSVGNEQKVDVPGLTQENFQTFIKPYLAQNTNVIFETDMIGFFCVVIPRFIIDEIGLLDEKFGIGMFEDSDYCMRVMKAGYKLGIAEGSFVYHQGSFSFKKFEDEKYQEIFQKNKSYYNEKHGVEWKFSGVAKSYITRLFAELNSTDPAETVLQRIKLRAEGFNFLTILCENFELEKNQLKSELQNIKH